MAVILQQFSNKYAAAVLELVHGILTEEFEFSSSAAEQPDLYDVSEHYGDGASNFWIALDDDQVVGTIGFVDLGGGIGLLRKMFVRSDHRRIGVAELLFNQVLSWLTDHNISAIYLGTNSRFHAAHRFYAKHDFVPIAIESLPDKIPRLELRDQFFYRLLNEVK